MVFELLVLAILKELLVPAFALLVLKLIVSFGNDAKIGLTVDEDSLSIHIESCFARLKFVVNFLEPYSICSNSLSLA